MIQPRSIQNAGLVILNPFLPNLFHRLGMLEEGRFVNKASQYRAVVLLQHIVTGNMNASNDDLLLNKVLCGVSAEEIIPPAVQLSNEEAAIINDLLHAVMDNWEKMRNSTNEPFRSSFLAREGILTMQEDSWRLSVKNRGYDVLLQTLPWTIGMVKLSWMDGFIYVEWV